MNIAIFKVYQIANLIRQDHNTIEFDPKDCWGHYYLPWDESLIAIEEAIITSLREDLK